MNQSVFVGRLTHDIELSKSQSGVISTRFTLAVPRKGSKETTDFIPCVAFGKTAELIDQLTKKRLSNWCRRALAIRKIYGQK